MDHEDGYSCDDRAEKEYLESVLLEHGYFDPKLVDQGTFGRIFATTRDDSTQKFGIKEVVQDKRFKQRELHMLYLLRKHQHPNIIRLIESFVSEDMWGDSYLYVVMPLMDMNLHSYIVKQVQKHSFISNLEVQSLMYQLCSAINHIHNLRICHRDIKPHNILINAKEKVLKVCDFGSAKRMPKDPQSVAKIGARWYRAPECLMGWRGYSFPIDIWAVGCCLAEITTGKAVFGCRKEEFIDQLQYIINRLGPISDRSLSSLHPAKEELRIYLDRQAVSTRSSNSFLGSSATLKGWDMATLLDIKENRGVKLSNEIIDFAKRVLRYNPSERMTAKEMMVHPLFESIETKKAAPLFSSPALTSATEIASISTAAASTAQPREAATNLLAMSVSADLGHQHNLRSTTLLPGVLEKQNSSASDAGWINNATTSIMPSPKKTTRKLL